MNREQPAITTVDGLLESISSHREAFLAGVRGAGSLEPSPHALALDLLEHVKQLVLPLHIRVVAENLEAPADPLSLRLLLSCSRDAASFENELARRANGLILRLPLAPSTAERPLVLVHPPNNFTTHYGVRALEEHLAAGLYRQYAMREGTTLTLYHHGGRWVIGSRRSLEADDLVWRSFTFRRVLEHTLSVACPKFRWEALNPAHSYTIGYHHPAHHPFGQGNMWERRLFDRVSSEPDSRSGWLIEAWFIRSSESAPPATVAAAIGIPLQQELAKSYTLKGMRVANDRALPDYRQFLAGSEPSFTPHMGFILRSTDEARTQELSDVLLPSSLYRVIRDLFYESAYRRRDIVLSNNHRHLSFVLLSNYVDQHKSALMQELFPQFATYYNLYHIVFAKAVEFIALMNGEAPLVEPGPDCPPPVYTAYLLALRMGGYVRGIYSPETGEGHPRSRSFPGGKRGRERASNHKVLMELLCDPRHIAGIYEVVHMDAPRRLQERSEEAIARHNQRRL